MKTTHPNRMRIVKKLYPQVTSIVDAKRPAMFEVTTADSKKSTKKSVNNCALAEACKREYDGAIIAVSTAYLIKGKRATRYQVPSRVARELVSFDRHKHFAPGVYTLNVPSPTRTMNAEADRKRDRVEEAENARTKNGPQRIQHRTEGVRKIW